ncbi:hypothetical protein GLAREA_09315 [Glarea lozoyensis ATCC 20868]|uniref:Uncharacterized protein n=1 Tax=Glarea lozoyensis (strain ATCC 20868 / MF5171) TaxID=1116229 RepID=S3DFG3_GLAL2|nr:uncharacterized protein GLAREA_09315 [Glarea lozoyensis ATCC 20868]EPE37152.1 hypothetical protein GLAREA_09315 [Glarea lozoyensis ATCC 20868]
MHSTTFFTVVLSFSILAHGLPLSTSSEVTRTQVLHLSRIMSRAYNTTIPSATLQSATAVVTSESSSTQAEATPPAHFKLNVDEPSNLNLTGKAQSMPSYETILESNPESDMKNTIAITVTVAVIFVFCMVVLFWQMHQK